MVHRMLLSDANTECVYRQCGGIRSTGTDTWATLISVAFCFMLLTSENNEVVRRVCTLNTVWRRFHTVSSKMEMTESLKSSAQLKCWLILMVILKKYFVILRGAGLCVMVFCTVVICSLMYEFALHFAKCFLSSRNCFWGASVNICNRLTCKIEISSGFVKAVYK